MFAVPSSMCRASCAVVAWLAAATCLADASSDRQLTLSQAKAAFDALVAAKKSNGDLPHLADPSAAPILRRIWAAAVPAGTSASGVTAADVVAASEVSTAEFHLFETYLYFPAPSPKDIDFDALAKRFGPELAETFAASIAAASRLSATFEAYRTVHPDPDPAHHKAMVQLLRSPGLGLVVYGEKFMLAATARPQDVIRVAVAFGAHGPDFASLYSKDERAMIGKSFRHLAPKLATGPRQDIARAAEAFDTAPCGPSCAIPP